MLIDRVQTIRQTIAQAARDSGRSPENILLLAASKAQPVAALREAYQAGVLDFGENYLQEALAKQQAMTDLAVNWHFIGPIQSRKCAAIGPNFDWVHTIGREKIAHGLNQHRPSSLPPLQVCIQINLDKEESKAGVLAEDCLALARVIDRLPQLNLRGLMAIPMPRRNPEEQYQSLLRLRHLQDKLNEQGFGQLDTLSMGMSDDLAAAIRAGSSIVRIGRALFGERV